jgi:4a-hydroxytetrahydrobiopterin dehydratase
MKLSKAEVTKRLTLYPGWSVKGDSIVRTYSLPSFADAIAFVTRLAFDAEAADHHPDIRIAYKKVTVAWSTHDAGGLTAKDFAGAKQADSAAARYK